MVYSVSNPRAGSGCFIVRSWHVPAIADEWNGELHHGRIPEFPTRLTWTFVASQRRQSTVWGGCNNGSRPGGYSIRKGISDSGSCSGLPDYYRDVIELPDAFHPPPGFQVPIQLMPPMPITTPITVYLYANPPSATPTIGCTT